jgi:TolB-like protein
MLKHVFDFRRGWPGQALEENNVQVQIHALRRALGRDRDLIQTVAGRGYRFVGELLGVGTHSLEEPGPPLSIIVLPFHNLRGDPSLDYIVDGITESLITDISRALPGSFVVSRTTSFTYRDHAMNARRIGREVGVRYVLDGSVLLDKDLARVNAELIDTLTDGQLGRIALTRSVLAQLSRGDHDKLLAHPDRRSCVKLKGMSLRDGSLKPYNSQI